MTEQRARELLAAEFEASGHPKIAADVLRGHAAGHCTPLWMDESLAAITKALSPSPVTEGEVEKAIGKTIDMIAAALRETANRMRADSDDVADSLLGIIESIDERRAKMITNVCASLPSLAAIASIPRDGVIERLQQENEALREALADTHNERAALKSQGGERGE